MLYKRNKIKKPNSVHAEESYLSIYDELSEKDDIVWEVSVNYSALPNSQKTSLTAVMEDGSVAL